jgi:WD40 repeat protein
MRFAKATPILIAGLALTAGSALQAEPDTAPRDRSDYSGAALPPGALARMGNPSWHFLNTTGAVAARWITLRFSGKHLATITGPHANANVVNLWELTTGRKIVELPIHCDRPGRNWRGGDKVVFSPDGKYVAVAQGMPIRIFDVATTKELHTLGKDQEDNPIYSLAISDDNKLLAALYTSKTVQIWDLSARKEVSRFRIAEAFEYCSLTFSPDAKSLAGVSGVYQGSLIGHWRIEDGHEIGRYKVADSQGRGGFHTLAFSPDGKTLAAGAWGTKCLYCWDVVTRKELPFASAKLKDGITTCLAFTPDGKMLAYGTQDEGRAQVWLVEPATGKVQIEIPLTPGSHIQALAFSPEGRILATGGYAPVPKQSIRFWDVTKGKE